MCVSLLRNHDSNLCNDHNNKEPFIDYAGIRFYNTCPGNYFNFCEVIIHKMLTITKPLKNKHRLWILSIFEINNNSNIYLTRVIFWFKILLLPFFRVSLLRNHDSNLCNDHNNEEPFIDYAGIRFL